jgi:2-C-methyl-D-erythritol 2,4-cyclodiphosphate synthase
MFRIGYGNDIHRLAPGKPLILGGVRIESDLGAEGHSDADALTHAITDAIFGALAEGDIGTHFSDGEERWKSAESFVFLRYAVSLAKEKGFAVENVDSTVNLERPKLRPYIDRMRESLAVTLEVEVDRVSVKAKTGEGVGEVGTRAAVRAEAVVLLRRI